MFYRLTINKSCSFIQIQIVQSIRVLTSSLHVIRCRMGSIKQTVSISPPLSVNTVCEFCWALIYKLNVSLRQKHTYSCKLKGTPSTSKRSISKSTPMVALQFLSNAPLQNLTGTQKREREREYFRDVTNNCYRFLINHFVYKMLKLSDIVNNKNFKLI